MTEEIAGVDFAGVSLVLVVVMVVTVCSLDLDQTFGVVHGARILVSRRAGVENSLGGDLVSVLKVRSRSVSLSRYRPTSSWCRHSSRSTDVEVATKD